MNKRTALYDNLMAFPPDQQYQIIKELCDHPKIREFNAEEAYKVKMQLLTKYEHLRGAYEEDSLNEVLLEQTQHWLDVFPESLQLYREALQKHEHRVFNRNALDDLRLSLEVLLKSLLRNSKSLENQIPVLGQFIKEKDGSRELANMFVKLVEYYTKYQNTDVKEDDAVIEEEVEFVFEITSSFMKHLVRLSARK